MNELIRRVVAVSLITTSVLNGCSSRQSSTADGIPIPRTAYGTQTPTPDGNRNPSSSYEEQFDMPLAGLKVKRYYSLSQEQSAKLGLDAKEISWDKLPMAQLAIIGHRAKNKNSDADINFAPI